MDTLQTRNKRLGIRLFLSSFVSILIPIAAVGFYYSTSMKMQEAVEWTTLAAIAGIAMLISLLVTFWSVTTFMRPIHQIVNTIYQILSGHEHARISIDSGNELQQIANGINAMMDDRRRTIEDIVRENDSLNESVIALMEATSELSNKDLTIKVPVKEDVTGTIADAMNQMVQETARVLRQIKQVAGDVREAAHMVKVQGDKVATVAASERSVIKQTRQVLHLSASNMSEIASSAKVSKNVAFHATQITEQAADAVSNSVDAMQEIRETISETEKRIKRLGERSQEITSVVEIINNIAERTNVLALNASMQAAAAGEAGRSFAVVADEVQRLAENSRNSTSQIATLVRNIQTETSETMATMNRTIDQVVSGSKLAERAGKQMRDTNIATSELVSMVEKIAEQAIQQEAVAQQLLENADDLQKSTQDTADELLEQAAHTDNLNLFAKTLIETVDVFRLPGDNSRSA